MWARADTPARISPPSVQAEAADHDANDDDDDDDGGGRQAGKQRR